MRWILGLVAALVLSSVVVAQEVAPDQPNGSNQPAESKCFELDEEQQALYEALTKGLSYFDDLDLECEQDWIDAETTFGTSLKTFGESPLVEPDASAENRTFTIRRLVLGDSYRPHYKLSRLDCDLNEDFKSTGGRFLLREKSPWFKPNNGHWELKLTPTDCDFIVDLFDDYAPRDIQTNLPCDPEGAIILHANVTMTEYNAYSKGSFLRQGSCDLVDDDAESKAAEANLDKILYWLEGRTREGGRKVRRSRGD